MVKPMTADRADRPVRDPNVTTFRRPVEADAWLVEGPASEVIPGEVVGVERRDGSISWVWVTEVVERGLPAWADGVEVVSATFLPTASWRRGDGDVWLVASKGGWVRQVVVDGLTPHPTAEGWMLAEPVGAP